MVRIGQLSQDAWTRIEPLLPSSSGCRGGQWRDHRQVIEAIAWRYRTGSPWRDLPAELGPWQTAWKRLDRWSRDGTLDRLLAAAHTNAEVAAELDWVASVDSSVARAHQHAAGARHHEQCGDRADDVEGRDVEDGAAPETDTGGRVESQESGAAAAPGCGRRT